MPDPAVTLLFRPGQRPDSDGVRALSGRDPRFEVTAGGTDTATGASGSEHWVELLMNGLTFDLVGLSPGKSAPVEKSRHVFSMDAEATSGSWEAIVLKPGPHLSSGRTMPPVLRSLAWLGAMLAEIPGVEAVIWHSASIWSSPDYFRRTVINWIEGGVFPGFGLTALVPVEGGGMRSEGLACFIGLELSVAANVARDQQDLAKLSLRIVHWLVEHGGLESDVALTGPSGEPIVLRPDPLAGIIRAERTA